MCRTHKQKQRALVFGGEPQGPRPLSTMWLFGKLDPAASQQGFACHLHLHYSATVLRFVHELLLHSSPYCRSPHLHLQTSLISDLLSSVHFLPSNFPLADRRHSFRCVRLIPLFDSPPLVFWRSCTCCCPATSPSPNTNTTFVHSDFCWHQLLVLSSTYRQFISNLFMSRSWFGGPFKSTEASTPA